MEDTHTSIQPFFIEIDADIFTTLSQICTKEGISIKHLTSRLISHMMCRHAKETREIGETIKKRAFR